jgi:hypothetical protein
MMRLAVTTRPAIAGLAFRNDSLTMTSDRVGTVLPQRTPLFIDQQVGVLQAAAGVKVSQETHAQHYIITWLDLPKNAERSPVRFVRTLAWQRVWRFK